MNDRQIQWTTLFLFLLFSLPIFAYSQSEIQTQKINFEKGKSEITIEDSIKGYQIIDYILNAKAGQKITVYLTTSNSANYFNLMAPGEEYVAFYNSSMGENKYEGVLEKSGDQKIRVYLMRSAARRNEVADYKIHISITP